MRINRIITLGALAVAACSETPVVAPVAEPTFYNFDVVSGVGGDGGLMAERAAAGSSVSGARLNGLTVSRSVQTFPVVLVRSGPGAANSAAAGAPVVDNLVDAAARVAPGGVIRIFSGTYAAEGVLIDRPVTIEPMPNANVLIRTQGANSVGFDVAVEGAGTVTFRRLSFEVGPTARSGIALWNSEVVVENAKFNLITPNPSLPSGAVAGVEGGGVSGKAKITGSQFAGGQLSIFGYSGGSFEIRGNSFSGQTFGSIQFQAGANAQVENNTIKACGIWGCVRSFQSTMHVVDNTLEESRTDVNGFNHNLVFFTTGSTGTVTDNQFNGCGFGQCVTVVNLAVVDILRNEFTIPHAHGTRFVVAGSDGTVGAQPNFAARAPTLLIADNVIRGVGGNPSDWTNAQNFAIRNAGILLENAAVGKVYRNTIENAVYGINGGQGGNPSIAGADGGNIEGSDNKTHLTFTGVFLFRESQATLRSNDITNSRYGVQLHFTTEPSDLTCNYYGNVDIRGNTFSSTATAATWTPWATSPVAGTSTTTCSGM